VSTFRYSSTFSIRAGRWFKQKRQAWRWRRIAAAPQPPFEQFSLDSSVVAAELADQLPPNVIVHLHWVADFVDHLAFFSGVSGRQLVWTLHDMNPFSGGCHFDNHCARFQVQCGRCPQLGSMSESDLSHEIWCRKKISFGKFGPKGLQLVSPSRWLAKEAGKSSLMGKRPCITIPSGLDTDVFAPIGMPSARDKLGLPHDARIVLFVAAALDNPRKGMGHLLAAIEQIKSVEGLFLLSVGANPLAIPAGLPSCHIGSVNDDGLLAAIYSAADIFVIPSLADNLPNTVLESMSCGTPVVGYSAGGIPELVEPMETGLLAETGDVKALARAIERILLDRPLREHCSRVSRARILDNHTLEAQAQQYLRVYSSPAPSHAAPSP
jgi:glycosyltransferase involved in cell wall biosynthesis